MLTEKQKTEIVQFVTKTQDGVDIEDLQSAKDDSNPYGFTALDQRKVKEFPEIYEKYKIADCYMPWSRLFEIGLKIEEK